MQRVKHELSYRVPSWALCNLDTITDDMVNAKTCRFCIKTKEGYKCILHDETLSSKGTDVRKADACARITAGFTIAVEEPQPISVDPKLIIKESLKAYNKTLSDLLASGYPRSLAEKVATEHLLKG